MNEVLPPITFDVPLSLQHIDPALFNQHIQIGANQDGSVNFQDRLQNALKDGSIHPFLKDHERHERMRKWMYAGIPSVADLKGKHQGGVACVVGSGPTLKSKLDELVELYKDGAIIFAVNTAHDHLWKCNRLSKIKPRVHYGVLCDSNDWVATYMRPHKKTKYLLASQCHDKTFAKFKKSDTYLWHAIQKGDVEVLKTRTGSQGYTDYGVRLGTTVGLRTVQLAMATGVSRVHMFGFDSCAAVDNDTDPTKADLHATNKDSRRVDNRFKKNEYFCQIRNQKFTWYTNDAMAVQAMEFEQIIYQLGQMVSQRQIQDCKLIVHGDDEFIPFLAANHDMHATPEKNKTLIAWNVHENADNYMPSQVTAARNHLENKGILQRAA